jgi:hypothetical protein
MVFALIFRQIKRFGFYFLKIIAAKPLILKGFFKNHLAKLLFPDTGNFEKMYLIHPIAQANIAA